jgi:type IV secretion system protein VirD4
VVAPTRSGKGVGVVIPTLLTWPESVLVYDLKSENWTITAGCRKRFSHVIYFNPNDICSAHFNPLLEVRFGDLEVRDVQNIADMVVDPEGRGLGDHWAKTGHSLLVGTILHVLYAEKNKTLAGVADFLSNPEKTIEQTLHMMMHAEHIRGCTHPVVASAAREMLNKSTNECSGVLSTAMSFLSLYRDPIVARNTADSDFNIVDLMQAERPVSLYLVIPPSDINRLRPLFRLIINQICRRLTEELNPSGRKHRLLMLLDEFPALGKLDFFDSALGVIAGYGIKAMLISQSTNQLDSTYGSRNSIIDNSHVRVFFAPNTIETAEMMSRMLGQKTQVRRQENLAGSRMSPWLNHVMVADQESARALMTPGEVMELPQSDELVFVTGRPPIRAKKIRYYEDENFTSRLLPPPVLRPERPYPYRPGGNGEEECPEDGPDQFEWTSVQRRAKK